MRRWLAGLLGVIIIISGLFWLPWRTDVSERLERAASRTLTKIQDETTMVETKFTKPSPRGSRPPKVLQDVPFTSQSPFGDWQDPREQDGCEEASLAMASAWVTGQKLSSQDALRIIHDAAAWEEEHMNNAPSLSVDDTVKLAKNYFALTKVSVKEKATVDSIKEALASKNLVIVPVNGQALGNPYYTAPGPPEHMLVIRGYDEAAGVFITNDPGTRRGQSYRYAYQVLMNALREYPTGHREPISETKRTMIIVSK